MNLSQNCYVYLHILDKGLKESKILPFLQKKKKEKKMVSLRMLLWFLGLGGSFMIIFS